MDISYSLGGSINVNGRVFPFDTQGSFTPATVVGSSPAMDPQGAHPVYANIVADRPVLDALKQSLAAIVPVVVPVVTNLLAQLLANLVKQPTPAA